MDGTPIALIYVLDAIDYHPIQISLFCAAKSKMRRRNTNKIFLFSHARTTSLLLFTGLFLLFVRQW